MLTNQEAIKICSRRMGFDNPEDAIHEAKYDSTCTVGCCLICGTTAIVSADMDKEWCGFCQNWTVTSFYSLMGKEVV